MPRFLTRRGLCRLLPVAAASARFAPGQMTSPAGAISIHGVAATFSVDYPRPMESVAYTFIQEYGWRITFEEAPLVYPGDIVDVTRDYSHGIRAFDPRGGRLEFSYDLGPDGTPPKDPERVLRAAVEAYHGAGLPGRYDLIRARGYLHIVPVASADERGVLQPVRSPLNAVVTIEGGGRFPDSVLEDLLKSIEEVSGYQVVIGRTPFPQGIQPRIQQRYEHAEARAVLRDLIAATSKPRVWYMMYSIGLQRYVLSVV